MKKNIVLLMAILHSSFLILNSPLSAQPSNYTYNYDFWDEQVTSPDPYRVSAYILGNAVGAGSFRDPQGLFIKENRIYVCDTGNHRIVLLEALENGDHVFIRSMSSVMIDGEPSPLKTPKDIFEARDGSIYIADQDNQRILKLDSDWNFVSQILKPEDETIDEKMDFLPVKLTVDFANRLFVQVTNVNKGLMEFDSRGEFAGYMGANKVKVNIIDYIWKMLATQAQREKMDLFIPTEYNNVCLDNEGFIYATNRSAQADSVRRLNAMGQDILIRNGYNNPEGDVVYGNAGGISGPSRFIDVAAMDNDSYACFDSTRGRIFMYDFQGNLLYAFGGRGNREGYFQLPVAIANMGYSLYALDSTAASITRFDLTLYGEKINQALNEYKAGRYDSSAEIWEEVLKMNGNYDLAYIGIGRAALRQGEYQKAMKYYKLKNYRIGYGKAFQLYRKQWIEENLWKVVLCIILVLLGPVTIKNTIRFVKEVRAA